LQPQRSLCSPAPAGREVHAKLAGCRFT
jgi:hypothetical protein